jgi:hypothetical protein
VIVAGGSDDAAKAKVEEYDPAANAWGAGR